MNFMKTKKIFIIALIGLSSVFLTGCLKKENTNLVDVAKEKIADVVETSKSTHCIISTTEGGTIETWTKGEKTKAYGANIGGGAGAGYMISDGQWTYLWVEGATKGTKYPVTNEETPRSEGEGFEGEMPDVDARKELAEHQVADFKQECTEKNIPDSTFVPPTTVEFVDMMEKLGGMVEKLEGAAGSLEDFKQE